MLKIANRLSDLNLSYLNDLYSEATDSIVKPNTSDFSNCNQLLNQEQDFYSYLRDVFFKTRKALYAVWVIDGRYMSALRAEPYRDGMIISALITAPKARRKGYAENLLKAIISYLSTTGNGCIYSHIARNNQPSIELHKKCGFSFSSDVAVFLDGSVSRKFDTYILNY